MMRRSSRPSPFFIPRRSQSRMALAVGSVVELLEPRTLLAAGVERATEAGGAIDTPPQEAGVTVTQFETCP